MDPEANLREQIELANEIARGCLGQLCKSERLAELVLDMNEWLSKGGALPKAWQAKQQKAKESEPIGFNPDDYPVK